MNRNIQDRHFFGVLAAATLLGTLSVVSVANAHIHLTLPESRTAEPLGQQKEGPCGTVDSVRTNKIATYKPGEKVFIEWDETQDHPGHYRIAFQKEGQTFPNPPDRGTNLTGMTDAGTGAIILADQIPDGTDRIQVTMPDMECENCTIQFIQFMYFDVNNAGNYDASRDLYYNCGDVVLKADPAAPVDPEEPGEPEEEEEDLTHGGKASGGCSTGTTESSLLLAALSMWLTYHKRS